MRPVVVGVLTAGLLGHLSACGTSVLNLQVGQCVADGPQGEGGVSTLPVVDRAQPHTRGIYALPQVPDGEFPGEEAVREQAKELCSGEEFENYVGVSYQASETHVGFFLPSADTWDEGDREIVCMLRNEADTETTGSLRGSDR